MIEEQRIRSEVEQNWEELLKKHQKEEALRMTKKYVEEQLNMGKGGSKKRKLDQLKKNFDKLNPPKLVKEIFEEEYEKLQTLDNNSMD